MLEEKTSKQKVIEYFLENPTATNLEISEKTGISKSSVQRYLSDPSIGNITILKTNRTIAEQIRVNTQRGRQKGGRATFQTHQAQKDEKGRFIGTKKEIEEKDKEALKRQDIIQAVLYFSKNPYMTIDQIANDLEGMKTPGDGSSYTKDYIYRCLTDSRVGEIFGSVIASSIRQRLDENRYSILNKLENVWNPEFFESAGLTKHEIAVLHFRFSEEGIRSADAAAIYFGVSRNAILKSENNAIEKLKNYQAGMGQK